MRHLFFLIIILLFVLACKKNETNPKVETKPKACFSFSPNNRVKNGDTIRFIDCSENAATILWNFGDGTLSTEKTPKHIYDKSGNYKIVLLVTFGEYIDTVSKLIYVEDRYFSEIDTTLNASNIDVINSFKFFLDIDKDKISDIQIYGYAKYWPGAYGGTLLYLEISAGNDFETCYSMFEKTYTSSVPVVTDTLIYFKEDTFSIMVSKAFQANDTIHSNDFFTKSCVYLTYYLPGLGPASMPEYLRTTIDYKSWIGSGYRYIAFRKSLNTGYLLAWLMVKVNDYDNIYLKSCKYYLNQNDVIISE